MSRIDNHHVCNLLIKLIHDRVHEKTLTGSTGTEREKV